MEMFYLWITISVLPFACPSCFASVSHQNVFFEEKSHERIWLTDFVLKSGAVIWFVMSLLRKPCTFASTVLLCTLTVMIIALFPYLPRTRKDGKHRLIIFLYALRRCIAQYIFSSVACHFDAFAVKLLIYSFRLEEQQTGKRSCVLHLVIHQYLPFPYFENHALRNTTIFLNQYLLSLTYQFLQ